MKAKLLRTVLLCSLIFSLNSCTAESDEVNTNDAAVVTTYNYSVLETELAEEINNHRLSIGLNKLELVNHVSFKSGEHNNYMIENQVVNHDQFQERANNIMSVLGAEKVNENIAYNYQAPAGAMHAWLHSPGHKANIEGNFTHFGISITIDPQTGKKYYTNIFVKK